MRLRLGIDVGGTNTDTVILDESNRVVARHKAPGTGDVVTGIANSVSGALDSTGIDPRDITHAMLGTTQVTNAIIERKNLSRVGIIRLGAPATEAIRPLAGWPVDLRAAVEGPAAILPGGVEYDGRPITPFAAEEVVRAVQEMATEISVFAVSSVFSPVLDIDERRAAEIIRQERGANVTVSISSEIGSVGFLERENATILNAAVTDVAGRVTRAFGDALTNVGIDSELFLAQNDGTLMSREYAMRYPILTVACGPTNSIRGASYLTGLRDALIIDVGGTSTDIGILTGGFPRESALAVDIGGVRTNFRMPDLISLGLGGGSIIRWDDTANVDVGPDSVGHAIGREALCFGGTTLTMTDVAVARGMARLGDPSLIRVDRAVIDTAYDQAIAMIEDAIDRMKPSAADVPVIVVGGGSIILPERLAGVSAVLRPENFDVANAIGAAIAQVSGDVDRIFSLDGRSREDVLHDAREHAFAQAIRAGAEPASVTLIDLEEVPLAYLPGNAVRVKAKAAGELRSSQRKGSRDDA